MECDRIERWTDGYCIPQYTGSIVFNLARILEFLSALSFL